MNAKKRSGDADSKPQVIDLAPEDIVEADTVRPEAAPELEPVEPAQTIGQNQLNNPPNPPIPRPL
jgi:hypothetical protein